jgi:hypothetical protein
MAGIAKWVYTGIMAAVLGFVVMLVAFRPEMGPRGEVVGALLGLALWGFAVFCFIAGLVAAWRKPAAAPTAPVPSVPR